MLFSPIIKNRTFIEISLSHTPISAVTSSSGQRNSQVITMQKNLV
ncbi:MAG: hypothetical protein QG588_1534, partial [Candidatus Poribacteria bacterium]|nr:hypothetical protein [Candidatus Poribacteria bacterium]